MKLYQAWEQRKLGEIANKVTKKNQDAVVTEVFTNSAEFGIISQRDFFDKDIANAENINSYYVVEPDDFVYNSRISTTAPFGPIKRNKLEKTGAMSPLYYVFKPHDIDLTYLEGFFQTTRWHAFMKFNGNSGARSDRFAITDKIFNKMPISMPQDIDEQRMIGMFLTELDHLITLHQRKCNETKELKKFMLQKMFPKKNEKKPEIRFAGFDDDWEQRKLLEFGLATGGTSIESEFSEDGIYKVISIGSYSEDSVYRDQGIRAVRSDKTVNRILNKGDITMILNDKTASGNIIGRVLLIEESGVYVYNQRTERIEVDNSNYDSQFIYTMLNAPEIRDKIIKQSQGNTQIYVNWTTISQTDYLVPQLSEQRKIGEYFRSLDHLITLHQRKCDEAKEMKKFMLQNMFPKKG